MKFSKKILSVIAAIAFLVTALPPVTARAASDSLDFEDGKVPEGVYMALKEDGTTDGDPSLLSVVKFNGSQMLKIDSQKKLTPKVKFDVAKLVGEKAYTSVVTIEYDMILEQTAKDKMVEWNGGTIAATPTGPSNWSNNKGWEINEWEKNVSKVTKLSCTLGKGLEFTDPAKAFFMYMNWGNNGTDIYIDNIVFKDADGKVVPLLSTSKVEPTKTATPKAKAITKKKAKKATKKGKKK